MRDTYPRTIKKLLPEQTWHKGIFREIYFIKRVTINSLIGGVTLYYDRYNIGFDIDKNEKAFKESVGRMITIDLEHSMPGYVMFKGIPRLLKRLSCEPSVCEQLKYADQENSIFLIDLIIAHELGG